MLAAIGRHRIAWPDAVATTIDNVTTFDSYAIAVRAFIEIVIAIEDL